MGKKKEYFFDKKIALEQFRRRKEKNAGKQVDNSEHPRSPMKFYYCSFCGAQTQVLNENEHPISVPKTICDPCKVLHDHGLI